MAPLDPWGLPLALDVVSGEEADDWWSVPTVDRVLAGLGRQSVLVGGDSMMRALVSRVHLHTHGPSSLTPRAQGGGTVQQMPRWMEAGVAQGKAMTQVLSEDGKHALAEGDAAPSAGRAPCNAQVQPHDPVVGHPTP